MTATDHHTTLMLSFAGATVPDDVEGTIRRHDIAGVTLFRPNNYRNPEQLEALTSALQASRSGELPLLVAIDQEGGQLHAFGDPATRWAGNMALGAVDDTDLTRRVGAAMGRELRAVGVNVDYAPVADLATNPDNPATGARSFGEDPELVARHVGAMVEGLQSAGVAATMKHFPGKGDSSVDSHHAMPVIHHDRDHLETHEFLPFRAAIDAGVKVAMTGHFALPALTGSPTLPCTLAGEANTGLLRDEMGFDGVLITDALDMKALEQGALQVVDIIAAIRSGVDLLLLTADVEQQDRATGGLELALSRRLIDERRLAEARRRIHDLRRWVSGHPQPPLDVVGCPSHEQLNATLAERSITLVRNDRDLLPLSASADDAILVVETEPAILTPADTSDHERPRLGEELGRLMPQDVDRVVLSHDPDDREISTVLSRAERSDTVVIATAAATLAPGQVALVDAVGAVNDRVVVVAMRTPWDLTRFDDIDTYLCAWSVNPASARAAARAIAGLAPITGRLPVTLGRHERGSGVSIP